MNTHVTASQLRDVVQRGERIYAEKYQQQYESQYPDHYIVIEVNSGAAFLAQYPEDAIAKAQGAVQNGALHLIRIGAPSAYQLSYFSDDADLAWVL